MGPPGCSDVHARFRQQRPVSCGHPDCMGNQCRVALRPEQRWSRQWWRLVAGVGILERQRHGRWLVQRQPAEPSRPGRPRRQHRDRCPARAIRARPRRGRGHVEPEDRVQQRRRRRSGAVRRDDVQLRRGDVRDPGARRGGDAGDGGPRAPSASDAVKGLRPMAAADFNPRRAPAGPRRWRPTPGRMPIRSCATAPPIAG